MTLRLIRVLGLMGMAVGLFGCFAAEPPPFDPRQLQTSERSRAGETPSEPMQPLPTKLQSPFSVGDHGVMPTTTALPPTIATTTTIRLSLREVVQRAVANSLDVRVAGYDPAVNQARVVEAEADFDPVFFSNLQFQHQDNATGGQVIPNPTNPFSTITIFNQESDVYTSQTGIKQQLTSGGQVQLAYQATYNRYAPQQYIDPIFYQSNVTLQLTQPLLRQFGEEVNRARITIARNNQRISLLDFRKALEQNVSDLEKAYWQLVEQERIVKIQQDLLKQTVDTAELLYKRLKHDVSRLQFSQANASVEQRRAALVRQEAHLRDLSDQIKRLMDDPDMPVSSGVLILPEDDPLEEPLHFDLQDLINTALENRYDLAEQQIRVDSAGTTVKVARNNLLPKLDFVGQIGTQGLGPYYNNSIDGQNRFNNISYTAGFEFEVPIGNRAAEAIYRRTWLQRQEAIDQYRGLIEQVSLEVKTAAREVQTSWEEFGASREARFAAQDALLAIQQREQANEPLTPTFVQLKLDTQERLADARLAEVHALVGYNVAVSQLEKAQGTLLRYNNIMMEEDRLGMMGKIGK